MVDKNKADKPTPSVVNVDYQKNTVPEWVRQVIEAHLAIEAEDAKSAGALGYMARALVIATMPYKDPKMDAFTRKNGDFTLRILAGYEGGIPYGIYPRLMTSWITTEAVRTQSPVLELGDSLRQFLREVIEARSDGGGSRGTGKLVTEQMKRLFGSLITANYNKADGKTRGFSLRNVMIAEAMDLAPGFDLGVDVPTVHDAGASGGSGVPGDALWLPQQKADAGAWQSQVQLTEAFFRECIENPVPIDLRAYKSLRGSPLAMDIYTWLTYRMSYTQKQTRPIPWESLMMQFGSQFNIADLGQAKRDFKKAFLYALKAVSTVYPTARLKYDETGLILLPSPTHIPRVVVNDGGIRPASKPEPPRQPGLF